MLFQAKFLLGGSRSRYVKPSLIQYSSVSGVVITPQSYGYYLFPGTNSGDNGTYWYLDRNLKTLTKRVYWEVDYAVGSPLWGIMRNPGVSQSYGGYAGTNWGHYAGGPTWWRDSIYGGTWTYTSGPSGLGYDVMGYWFDPSNREFRVYKNNTLYNTLTGMLDTVPALYPLLTWQSTPSTGVNIRLGPGNTVYSPPDGADYY